MLEPRSATCGACDAQQPGHRERVVEGARPEAALGAAVAARVEGQRRHAVRPAAAGEVEVALLGGAGAVQDHHAHVRLAIGQEQRVGQPVVGAELGRYGGWVPH